MIYFIQAAYGGPIKIGYTRGDRDVKSRLRSLQTGNPLELRIVGRFSNGGPATEKLLHEAFSLDRIRNEWFYDSPGLQRLVSFSRFHSDVEHAEIELKAEEWAPKASLPSSRMTEKRMREIVERAHFEAEELRRKRRRKT